MNTEAIYRQWDMAFGSFTPIWKPHGPSHQRWPAKLGANSQASAKVYIPLRYQMMPYIYSYALQAQATGIPMVRPMFLETPDDAMAWEKDLQYYWGREMLIAPNCTAGGNDVQVWLPQGDWYDYWNDKKYTGSQALTYPAAVGVVPAFVRAGAILPMAPFAKSTFFIPKDTLIVHVYTGKDGTFQLLEDDGVTEKFRTKKEIRRTDIAFAQSQLTVKISPATGTFEGAPLQRAYQIVYHGLSATTALYSQGMLIPSYASLVAVTAGKPGAVWDAQKKVLVAVIPKTAVTEWVSVANDLASVKRQAPRPSVRQVGDAIEVDQVDPRRNVAVSIRSLDGRRSANLQRMPGNGAESSLAFGLPGGRWGQGAGIVQVDVDGVRMDRRMVVLSR